MTLKVSAKEILLLIQVAHFSLFIFSSTKLIFITNYVLPFVLNRHELL